MLNRQPNVPTLMHAGPLVMSYLLFLKIVVLTGSEQRPGGKCVSKTQTQTNDNQKKKYSFLEKRGTDKVEITGDKKTGKSNDQGKIENRKSAK